MKKLISIVACCLILVGCAAKPLISGDSTVQAKTASFPKQGQQVHAVVGGLVHLKADYQSGFTFRLVNPFSMSIYGGNVIISSGEVISQASLNGENVFCTHSMVFYGLLNRPMQRVCFKSAESGKFTTIKVPSDALWFDKLLSQPIDYVGAETAFSSGGKPLKRELIFEGSQNETLSFTEKIYENSIEKASRLKPLMIKVESTPIKVTLNGAEINIISYTNNSLTYSLEKAWD